MDAVVSLVRFNGDAVPAIGRALMTGLLVCERGHLVRWPRFAELERPRYVPLYTHTEFFDGALIVLDARLYNSRAGGHKGVAGTENLPHGVRVPYPVWRTWGPYNPRVLSVSDSARLTVARIPFGPLRGEVGEEVGFVRQAVTNRVVGFTPEFGQDLRARIVEVEGRYCPYCASEGLAARFAEPYDGPDVVQGHLRGWRMGAADIWPVEIVSRPRLFNHVFEGAGNFGGAILLEDPRGLVIWADAAGFEITSPDHETVACGEGVWYFQHPLPGSVD